MYREQIPETYHLKLGNILLQTCEFSQKFGVSLLFEYIGLEVDVPNSEKQKSNMVEMVPP